MSEPRPRPKIGRPPTGRVPTRLRLDPDVREALEREAERAGETLADAANRMLRRALRVPRETP